MADIVYDSLTEVAVITDAPISAEFVIDAALAGPQGAPGQSGPGLPAGGMPGDVLVKRTAQNLDAQWASMNNTSSVFATITQSAHGLFIGQLVYFNGTRFVLSKADSRDNAEVMGIVTGVLTNDTFLLTTEGRVTGLQNMAPGGLYYLSDTVAGQLTLTEPTAAGHVSKPVLMADSLTTGFFHNYRGNII